MYEKRKPLLFKVNIVDANLPTLKLDVTQFNEPIIAYTKVDAIKQAKNWYKSMNMKKEYLDKILFIAEYTEF